MTEENAVTIKPHYAIIKRAEEKFNQIVEETGVAINYKSEAMFALQSLERNGYLLEIAQKNPNSLRDAIFNVAAIGISLNPALQFAYLVPRDGAVCLDISYKGLLKIATDTGSILWGRAELVYENDKFEYHGPAEKPNHTCNPFDDDRGEFIGCYCIAKTVEGDILTEVMNKEQIYKVRNTSQAYIKRKPNKACVWVDWFSEMVKKTIIKRASKTWPRSDKTARLAEAVDVLNKHEGFAEGEIIDAEITYIDEQQCLTLYSMIDENDIEMTRFLKFAGVPVIEEILSSEYERCLAALKSMIKPEQEDNDN